MIRADVLGELKDSAAGFVALSELLASRRVGPKAIAAALPSAGEACAAAAVAARTLAADVLAVARDDLAAATEVRAIFERVAEGVRALAAEAAAAEAEAAPTDARTRLVLERAANAASSSVASGLFVAELFASASAPRVVSIHVADVLGFGPALAESPAILRATLDAPPGPVATTDARLLRALVELGVQIVAASGVLAPHVQVTGSEHGGARIRIAAPTTPLPPSSKSTPQRRTGRPSAPSITVLSVKRLPWSDGAFAIARAAATLAGADVSIDANRRGMTVAFS